MFHEHVDKDIPELRKGEPYMRFTIPFRCRTIYVYALSCACPAPHQERQPYFMISEYSDPCEEWWPVAKRMDEPPTLSYLGGYVLYELLQLMYDDSVTPQEMKIMYDIVLPYYHELSRETGVEYEHTFLRTEPVLCDCGAVAKRSGLTSHYKTKKHLAYKSSL